MSKIKLEEPGSAGRVCKVEIDDDCLVEYFFKSVDSIADSLIQMSVTQKTITRGQAFTLFVLVNLRKLKEHYYYSPGIRATLYFCYVVTLVDKDAAREEMRMLPTKFDMTPSLFEEERNDLQFKFSMAIDQGMPLSVDVPGKFSCVYYAFIYFRIEHRRYFKKKVLFITNELGKVDSDFKGVILENRYLCRRLFCCGEGEMLVKVRRKAPMVRVAREEIFDLDVSCKQFQAKGSLRFVLKLFLEVEGEGEERLKFEKELATQTVKLEGKHSYQFSFIISILDSNRADQNSLYTTKYRIVVEDIALGLWGAVPLEEKYYYLRLY